MTRSATRLFARFAAATTVALTFACSDTPSTSAPQSPLAAKASSGSLPDRYVLPGAAVFPEGVAVDQRSGAIFVSSTTDGTIFKGSLDSPTLTPFLAGGADGRTSATGLAVDDRGRLYVAGAGTGDVFIYDDASGALLAHLSTGSSPTFINDIVIAPDGSAYVTDSQNPVIYRITQNASGQFAIERWLELTGTVFAYQAGFNANGIEITPNGKYLIVVQSNTGELFRVDVQSRDVTEFNLDTPIFNADGILLQGNSLYVLQNAQGLLTEIRLDVNHVNATVVSSSTNPSFAYPTSLDMARGRLVVVNSQFDKRGPGLTPTLPFTVSVVKP